MPPLHAQKPLAAAEAGASISRLIEQVTRDPGKAVVIANENSEASAVLVDTLHYESPDAQGKTKQRDRLHAG